MPEAIVRLIETPAHLLTDQQRGERRLWAAVHNIALLDEHRIRRAKAKADRQNNYWQYL